MTGTIDLSAEQLATIAAAGDRSADVSTLVRVVIHPERDGAVRVVTHSLCFGDVLQGHFYALRNGVRMTGAEYEEHEEERAKDRAELRANTQ